MHSLSESTTFTFSMDNNAFKLPLTEPTSVVNIFIKVHGADNVRNSFFLIATFENNDGEKIATPFHYKFSSVDTQFLVPGKNRNNEDLIANFITFIYEEQCEAKELSNGDVIFTIEAAHLTEEERASYETTGFGVLQGGG
jgi:hypothetical protein